MNLQLVFSIALSFVIYTVPTFSAGPDVIVGFIDAGSEYSRTADGRIALTAGTNSCNAGDTALQWQQLPENQHPVISLNLYRLHENRMEQLAASWVKHGFFATNENDCAGIKGVPACSRADGANALGPGCSDLYGEALNARPQYLGPRSKIQPATGSFDGQDAQDLTGYPASTIQDRTLLVQQTELDTPGARFFLEAQYISQDDAGAKNARNNVTYKEVQPTLLGGKYILVHLSPEVRGEPSIKAWDNATFDEAAFETNSATVSYIIVGSKATLLPDGSHRYDYAVYNMNLDEGIQSLKVGITDSIRNVTFSAPHSHGEIWANDAWTWRTLDSSILWQTQHFSENESSNAVRWGTTYSFSFITSRAPKEDVIELRTFKPSNLGPTIKLKAVVPSN